jgi:hypothetical protein
MSARNFLQLHRPRGAALTRAALREIMPVRRRAEMPVVRDAEAVGWILSLMLRERTGASGEEACDVRIDLDTERLREHLRMSRARCEKAIERLQAAGVVVRGGGRSAPWLRFERGVLGSHPVLERMRADLVLGRLHGSPVSHAVLWCVAETHRGDPTEGDQITAAALCDESAYGETAVRSALRDLERAGLLIARERPGHPSEYRLSPVVLGLGEPAPVAAPEPMVAVRPEALRSEPRAPEAGTAPDLVLEIGGRRIIVGDGLAIDVRVDAEGNEVYTIGAGLRITLPRPG